MSTTVNGDPCVSLMQGTLVRPVARFPSGIATDESLKVAANRVQATLVSSIGSGDTLLTVGDASRLVPDMLLSIDSEIVSVTSIAGNVLTVIRGFDGTFPASHASGRILSAEIDAWHHNVLAAEVQAIEQALGPNLSHLPSSPFVLSTYFRFAQAPGGSLTPGMNAVTLTPVPGGVNGTDQNHWLWISGGTGTPEAVLIAGGTAVSGQAGGTVFVNCAGAHSGAWTIGTATSGIQEAVQSLPGSGKVWVPAGDHDMYAGVNVPVTYSGVYIEGFGEPVTRLNVAANANNSSAGFFVWGGFSYNTGGIRSLSINFIQPDSAVPGDYTQWKPAIRFANGGGLKIQDVLIQCAYDGVYATGCNGMDISNLRVSSISHSVWIDFSADSVKIRGLHVYAAYGLTASQADIMSRYNYGLAVGQVDDLQVSEYTAGTYVPLFCYTSTQTGGNTFGNLTNCNFDTYGGVLMQDGIIQISNSQFSPTGDCRAVYQSGGVLKLDAIRMFNMSSHAAVEAAFSVRMKRGGTVIDCDATLSIENSWIYNHTDWWFITSGIAGGYTGNANTVIVNNQFERPPNTAYAHPGITVQDGAGTTNRATVTGNRMTQAGTGSGIWLALGSDVAHVVAGNVAPGLTWFLPGTLQKARVDFAVTTLAVTSAATITPSGPLFHVTGTAAISNITTPADFPYTSFAIIPDGAFTLVASASIGKAATAVVGRTLTMTRDTSAGSVWYPSYT
jgi:hypothetical protein